MVSEQTLKIVLKLLTEPTQAMSNCIARGPGSRGITDWFGQQLCLRTTCLPFSLFKSVAPTLDTRCMPHCYRVAQSESTSQWQGNYVWIQTECWLCACLWYWRTVRKTWGSLLQVRMKLRCVNGEDIQN